MWSPIQTSWREFGRVSPIAPDADERRVYGEMIRRLQRDMLLLLMLVGLPLSLVFGVQLWQGVFGDRSVPASVFAIHVGRVLLLLACLLLLLRQQRVVLAWICTLAVTLITLLVQIWIMREPGLLIFALFSLAGPAIVFPLRATVTLSGAISLCYLLIVQRWDAQADQGTFAVLLFFGTLMLSFVSIGVVIRRFAWQFASVSVDNERAAVARASQAAHIRDLHERAVMLASLEHDLRQPLRAVQGYLELIIADPVIAPECAPLALAGAGRAERLINNLLDTATTPLQDLQPLCRPVALAAFFAELERTATGLAHYYTDPAVRVQFVIRDLSVASIDAPMLERAILNLLDNALAFSPPDGTVIVRAWQTASCCIIEVSDGGPGMPRPFCEAINTNHDLPTWPGRRSGLGLRQVSSAVHAHGGALACRVADGTTMRLELPIGGEIR